MPPTTISYSMFGSPFAHLVRAGQQRRSQRERHDPRASEAGDARDHHAHADERCRRPDSGGGVFRLVLWLRGAGQRAIGARVLADDGKLRGRSGKRRPLGARAGRRAAASRGSGVEGSKGSRGGVVRSWPAWRPPMRISEVSPGAAARRRAFALVGSRRGCGLGTTCWATAAAMTVRSSPAWRPPTLISDVEPGSAARTCVRWGRRGASAGCSSAGSATRVC